jgi:hypothetical protein
MLSALSAEGATADLDIWVRPSETNAARVERALTHFGAPSKKSVGRPQDLADVARLEAEAPPSA